MAAIALSLAASSFLGQQVPGKVQALATSFESSTEFVQMLWVLGKLFSAIYIVRVFYQLAINYYVRLLLQNVRTDCYSRWVLTFDMDLEKKGTTERFVQGEVLARLMNDSLAIRDLLSSGAFGIFIDLFFVLSCFVGLLQITTQAGLILGGLELLCAFVLFWGSKSMRDIFQNVRTARGILSQKMANLVGGVSDTYFTNHGLYASTRANHYSEIFLQKQLTANNWDASYYSIAESLYPLLLAAMGLLFPFLGIAQAALAFVLVDLIQRSIGPVKEMASKMANFQRAITGVYRIQEFLSALDKMPKSKLENSGRPLASFQSLEVGIEKFTYPPREKGRPSFGLQEIKFVAQKGQLLGIAGPSGHGKSTLLKILAGSLLPDQGQVALNFSNAKAAFLKPLSTHHSTHQDNQDFEQLLDYRHHVGLVSQESHIFSESLRFNLTLEYARDEKKDQLFEVFYQEMQEKIPYLKKWGLELDQKLDIRHISLGQKQLICALRACYLRKDIILFDEIAGALDSQLEEALRQVIVLVQKEALGIIVAHRLETIMQADQILVIENGQLKEIGTHQHLIHDSQLYRDYVAQISSSDAFSQDVVSE